MAHADSTNASPRLLKGIGLLAAIALMLTNAIGAGVFLKARVMICNVGTPGMVLLAYVVAGLFTLTGALIYAELSTLMPRSGGPYNYIGAAWGWSRWDCRFISITHVEDHSRRWMMGLKAIDHHDCG